MPPALHPPSHVGGYGVCEETGLGRRTPSDLRGVALVVTLILLAVITTLAIAFLGITHRETGAVDSMARTTDAELATDSALERAKAEIAAVYPGHNLNAAVTNTLGPDMIVSICCQNYDAVSNSPTFRRTIPYDRLDPDQRTTNRYDAAPPVFVQTNNGPIIPGQRVLDDRFFVDLNRNGIFEESGYVPNTTDNPAGPGRFQFEVQAGNIVTNWRIGDPQWIGLLQNPRQAHGPNNRYIARYAFMVLPAGRSLDVNWIHNEALENPVAGVERYYRNQGVGPWELNLAAFLADLNANEWNNPLNLPYYFTNNPPGGSGVAFQDARELLYYRYAGNRANRDNLNGFFPNLSGVFNDNQIDVFADGFASPITGLRRWSGTDSTNRFFSIHDYFDPVKLPKFQAPDQFRDRLRKTSNRGNSYDRYTFYRMLAQLGTDSVSEEDGRINLNYVNVPSWKTGQQLLASDLIRWTTNVTVVNVPRLGTDVDMGRPIPEIFFLTVVTNLLAREPALAFMVTNRLPDTMFSAPVFTNGSMLTTNAPLASPQNPGPLYAGRLHQILQLAANILDATTGSKEGEPYPYLPSVFRPRFTNDSGRVYIVGYTLVNETADTFLTLPWRDLESGDAVSGFDDLVYGIPLIIGARKGFPNFNEIGVATVAEAKRKLTMYREVQGQRILSTNQDFSLSVHHVVQVEARNPYASTNSRPVEMVVRAANTTLATNSFVRFPFTGFFTNYYRQLFLRGQWPAEDLNPQSSTYRNLITTPAFQHTVIDFRTNTTPELGGVTNRWFVSITNRLLFYLIDRSIAGGRIVDAVSLKTPTNHLDVAGKLYEDLDGVSTALQPIWNPGRTSQSGPASLSRGITAQIEVSTNVNKTTGNEWANYNAETASKDDAIKAFNDFLKDDGKAGEQGVPFTPMRRIAQVNYYQVNDPLVHYTLEDLKSFEPDDGKSATRTVNSETNYPNLAKGHIGKRNVNSQPWNNGVLGASEVADDSPGLRDTTLRDPGVISSDLWDFPVQQYPSVGWLGRVHRGTPWQTIYLKSRRPGDAGWNAHAGPSRNTASSALMRPERDWELADIFTVAPHPNATRGRLSVNQTNVAAWSALLSGVMTGETKDNPSDPGLTIASDVVMNPAAVSPLSSAVPVPPSIEMIVTNINKVRTLYNANQFNPHGQFTRLGQILAAPLLTDDSPFLNSHKDLFDASQPGATAQIYDADYERIPQQILSLLKVGEPRFVIYGWGQSLKPARLGVQYDGSGRIDPTQPLSGPSIDPGTKTVNNYQVTGEVATRSVVRVVFPEWYTVATATTTNTVPDYRRPRLVVESFNIIPVE